MNYIEHRKELEIVIAPYEIRPTSVNSAVGEDIFFNFCFRLKICNSFIYFCKDIFRFTSQTLWQRKMHKYENPLSRNSAL